MKTDSDRIKELLQHLMLSKNALGKSIGDKNGMRLQHVESGRNSISEKLAKDITEKYPSISYKWLLTGEGEMLSKEKKTETLSRPVLPTSQNRGVPYFDIDFTLGFAGIENSQQVVPDSYVTHPFFTGCDYIVRASGQSMAKIIKHGDAIGLTEIHNWQEFIPLGEVYAIVTKNGFRMIKVITKGEDDDHFTLISKPSFNKLSEFPPQQIKKSNILKIFKVQASSHLF